jgi:uncharacterized protein (DUF1330 family)
MRRTHNPQQSQQEQQMPKAYWVTTYRSVSNPEAMAAYAKLAGPALQGLGAKYLVRGDAAKVYENGVKQRVVISEWPSIEAAVAAHDSPGYQEALKALNNGADRDIRIVEGVE